MKVLWICSLIFPEVSEKLGISVNPAGGWLIQSSELLSKEKNIELFIASPYSGIGELKSFKSEFKTFYLFPNKNYNDSYKKLKDIVKPDIIHVYGTEMPHSWRVLEVFDSKKVVFSLQGIVSEYSKHFYAELPQKIVKRRGLYEIITKSSIEKEAHNFKKRGENEIHLLRNATYVIGRTEWDEAVSKCINRKIQYFHCNETLRQAFYVETWNSNDIQKHSIFVSQGGYPIKGIHFAIDALSIIVKDYPDAKLYVAGSNLLKNMNNYRKVFASSYAYYINKKIRDNNLQDHVVFVGNLSECEMVERFLKSNVYLCCSSIENSPNSLGEAMILGVPSVASYVGGIPSMLTDNSEGILYQYNSAVMLAEAIIRLFKDNEFSAFISKNARIKAQKTHNPQNNNRELVEIYKNILIQGDCDEE